jgi:hypothetical protein
MPTAVTIGRMMPRRESEVPPFARIQPDINPRQLDEDFTPMVFGEYFDPEALDQGRTARRAK